MSQKNFAVILLGANLGDKKQMFAQVETHITDNIGNCIKKSALYSSKAWGFESDDLFYNQVLIVETEYSAHDTLLRCQAIENKCGRVRHEQAGYESRTIDIDILYFNNDIIETDDLTIPHPLLHKRKFALVPLCEVLPEYIHPILLTSNKNLLANCEDEGLVEKVEE
ncbi:MAG: 2-amino-4-hydroxy-6-hydroxymethyldihydropteridine diphosphokinase [Bacteroidales bacterium]|nr:2-amino-4-hydroxy-6-hydroxymethyldihydropteridine diphosphokinase [Bacteroidales bacterium]MBR4497450.1 2-amino-4-hydroxy-6-hydroxymethyldihydropteridine diphosphokinase [Bacteroidales bacterium]MBR4689681.1 2-amino-4-hydroxy-6-hydroxymethyldihydropteridine diphosphokinase [Bacteroidales bacterium]MBR7034370.1 2-amino-4-hydroxy-6-hydroxymethyldihydropteridine diphosphokinase [Bacteroidales bacterium]